MPYDTSKLLFILLFLVIQMIAAVLLLQLFRNGKKAAGLITLGALVLVSALLLWFYTSDVRVAVKTETADRMITEAALSADLSEKDEPVREVPSIEEATDVSEVSETETEEAEPVRITLVAIGDMLMHPQVSDCYYRDGSLDYTDIFAAVKEEISAADIAVVNNEVPFGGDEYGLQNYPNFNVVTALGDAEASAGFDVILNATNHVRDMGSAGILNTIDFWKKYPEIVTVGVHASAEDREEIRIIEREGVKIALFNYTYGLNSGYPYETPYLVDVLFDSEKERIRAELQRAEEEADFTIVFPHWGEEYALRENALQTSWAQFFTECGADLIIGTHTHCLEPVKTVTAENGNTALCYYSLGNYISMQDETVAMLGGLAEVTLLLTEEGVSVSDYDLTCLVTHYDYSMHGSKVMKLEDYTRELAASHGIPTHGFMGDNNANLSHPFGYDTFYRIIEEIGR